MQCHEILVQQIPIGRRSSKRKQYKTEKHMELPSDAYRLNIIYLETSLSQEEDQQASLQDNRGRKPVLSPEARKELKDVIQDLASLGFAPTLADIGDLVKSYFREQH